MSVQSEINRIKSAISDAYDEVDAKGGTMPVSETVDNLADAIASIPSVDVSDTTATAGDVLAGAEFYNSSGVKTTGTIPVITGGEDTAIITSVNDQIEIEEGYHDGMGSVFIQRSDVLKLIPGNIKSGITVLGVSGSLTPGTDVSDTTAVASNVLETKDFYLANGTKTTGTMADQSGTQKLGTKYSSTNYMGLYHNSPGYYDTTSRVVMAKADFGTATASDVANGKTFASSSGWDITGTGTILKLLGTTSLGTISTTSTSATDTGKTATASGVNDYDLLIVVTSADTIESGKMVAVARLIWNYNTSTASSRGTTSIVSSTWHVRKYTNGNLQSRTGTTPYGIYPNSCTISNGTATMQMYVRYNSTSSGTINGTYTTRVYGVNLLNLVQ